MGKLRQRSAISADCQPDTNIRKRSNAVILRFLADFDEVSFSVAEFEDLRVATVLDWSHENAATGKLFVRFL